MATKSTHFTNSATEKTRPFAEWWRRSQGAGATRQMPASHLRARGCLHQWHRQQPAGGPNAFNQQNGWPSNIGPRHLDQSKGKSSCFFLHVIQLLMDCVWRSWQDSAVEPPKAPWKQGGLVGERPTMPRYQDWTKCASRLQVGSVKSQERDPSKGSIAMIANPFLGPFWCDEQMIWCSSEWVLHAKISLECAKLWAKPIIKGCLQKSLHAIGFFSAMVMYHKSMEFLMTNETSRLRGGLNESLIIAPMATIHVIANGCSIPSKPFPPTIQIPDESLVKV